MLRGILLGFALIVFSGCGNVIPNAEICADKGRFGAFCAYTIKGPERNFAKSEWDRYRDGMLCMDVEDFTKYQKFIERACEQTKNCMKEAKTKFRTFQRKMARGN